MRPTTVFLDWGGTLARPVEEFLQPSSVWGHVLSRYGLERSDEQIRQATRSADHDLRGRVYDYLGRTGEYWGLFDDRVMDVLKIESRRTEIRTTVEGIFDDPRLVHLYPEVRDVLATLRSRHYQTGLISNHTDGLLRAVQHHRLEPMLDTITYSQEARAEKPDPAVFQLALQRAGCAADQAVFVGDNLEADVGGARGVGMRPIWINRRHLPHRPDCPTITSLDGLIPLLSRLE